MRLICILLFITLTAPCAFPQNETVTVTVTSSCADIGRSAREAQHLALQRARSIAIEKAAGVEVSSTTMITDQGLAMETITSRSRGFIVDESVEWLDTREYRDDSNLPVAEYRLRLTATVSLAPADASLGLAASIDSGRYFSGDTLVVTVSAAKQSRIAVFSLAADDTATMLFPYRDGTPVIVSSHSPKKLPAPEAPVEITVTTLENDDRNAESIMVVATDASGPIFFTEHFRPWTPMRLKDFFATYSRIAHTTEERIIHYEVFNSKEASQ